MSKSIWRPKVKDHLKDYSKPVFQVIGESLLPQKLANKIGPLRT